MRKSKHRADQSPLFRRVRQCRRQARCRKNRRYDLPTAQCRLAADTHCSGSIRFASRRPYGESSYRWSGAPTAPTLAH